MIVMFREYRGVILHSPNMEDENHQTERTHDEESTEYILTRVISYPPYTDT